MDDAPAAKLTDRFLAYLLDAAPFVLGYYASLQLLLARLKVPNTASAWRAAGGAWLGFYLLYQSWGNLSGGTVGKRLFGLRVVGLDGSPLGLKGSLARAFGYLLSTPLANLGFVWAAFDPDGRALHDRLAGSRVVEKEPKPQAAAVWSAALTVAVLTTLTVANLWHALLRPTPADLEALRKAREGLRILAAMEEAYREREGRYTDRLGDLARISGDTREFKAAMMELFDPYGFRVSAGGGRYRICARARDSRRSAVFLDGPPAR